MEKLLSETITQVFRSLTHNWFPLSMAILVAAIMKVYINPEKLKQTLLRRSGISILASVIVGAFTPLCACGTMAVIIAMLTTTLPWGPIMAFLTSSPLMSPDGFIMLAGIINLNFAVAMTLASVIIGVGSGYITHIIEKKSDFLNNQTRLPKLSKNDFCSCSARTRNFSEILDSKIIEKTIISEKGCCEVQLCCVAPAKTQPYSFSNSIVYGQFPLIDIDLNTLFKFFKKIKWQAISEATLHIGIRQILLFYAIFVAVGFLINKLVPSSVIISLFSSENIFAVPLAALIGLPIYISGETSIPLIKSLMSAGASSGSMLAFLITGPGTSAWVVAGITTIMKQRAIFLYVFFILLGGIIMGYLYNLLLNIGL